MFHLVGRPCLHAAAASPLWSVDSGISVQFYLCSILFTFKKNTIKTKEVSGVLHKWLTFGYLLNYVWKVIDEDVGCSGGWFVFVLF